MAKRSIGCAHYNIVIIIILVIMIFFSFIIVSNDIDYRGCFQNRLFYYDTTAIFQPHSARLNEKLKHVTLCEKGRHILHCSGILYNF